MTKEILPKTQSLNKRRVRGSRWVVFGFDPDAGDRNWWVSLCRSERWARYRAVTLTACNGGSLHGVLRVQPQAAQNLAGKGVPIDDTTTATLAGEAEASRQTVRREMAKAAA